MGTLTREETALFGKMMVKVIEVLKQERKKEETAKKVRKIVIE